MYDQVVKCQRAGLCLSEHFLIHIILDQRYRVAMFVLTFTSIALSSFCSGQ